MIHNVYTITVYKDGQSTHMNGGAIDIYKGTNEQFAQLALRVINEALSHVNPTAYAEVLMRPENHSTVL